MSIHSLQQSHRLAICVDKSSSQEQKEEGKQMEKEKRQ